MTETVQMTITVQIASGATADGVTPINETNIASYLVNQSWYITQYQNVQITEATDVVVIS